MNEFNVKVGKIKTKIELRDLLVKERLERKKMRRTKRKEKEK